MVVEPKEEKHVPAVAGEEGAAADAKFIQIT